MNRRYARHRIRGFSQQTLTDAHLLTFSSGPGDRVGETLSLHCAALGVERQIWAASRIAHLDLTAACRSLTLNSACRIRPLTSPVAIALARMYALQGQPVYVCVDCRDKAAAGSFLGAAADLFSPALATALVCHDVSKGKVSFETGQRFGDLELVYGVDSPLDASSAFGTHGQLAAALLAADLIAALGAWRPAIMRMPRSRSRSFASLGDLPTPSRGSSKTLLVVGAGALGHAFLSAVLADHPLQGAFRRVVILDDDCYDLTNLNRQLLAEGEHNVGQAKALVTARVLRERWQGGSTEIVGRQERFAPGHLEEFGPAVVGMFVDTHESRAGIAAAASGYPGTLLLNGGTAFAAGAVRAHEVGAGCCFDCGPEELNQAVEEERVLELERASCLRPGEPANVVTNAIAGALAAAELRRWLVEGRVSPAPHLINWANPARVGEGPALPACGCHPAARAAS